MVLTGCQWGAGGIQWEEEQYCNLWNVSGEIQKAKGYRGNEVKGKRYGA